MTTTERALELCDKLGIKDPVERERFVWGYSHGSLDTQLDDLRKQIDNLTYIAKSKGVIFDAEIR